MKTLIISGARSLPALRWVRGLAPTGVRIVTTDSLVCSTAGASRYSHRFVRTPPPRLEPGGFAEAVQRILEEEKPDLWIPTYEEVFYLAHLRESILPQLPLLAPSFESLARVHHKFHFSVLARELGTGAEETILLTREDQVQAIKARAHEFAFKPVWSRGGEHTLIRPNPEQLDVLRPSEQAPWLAQTYLPGEEISSYAIAFRGRLIAHAAYLPKHRAGLGASIAFERVGDDSEARSFAEQFIRATSWHGQLGFDFKRNDQGRLIPMECNPRATSGIHFLSSPELISAIEGRPAPPDLTPRWPIIALALLTYGLPSALRQGGLGSLLQDLLRGDDVIASWKDPLPLFQQFAFLAEVTRLAKQRKISLHSAFTQDLEWEGAPLS